MRGGGRVEVRGLGADECVSRYVRSTSLIHTTDVYVVVGDV